MKQDVIAALKAIWKLVSDVAGTLSRHNMTDWAAALTYYALLATFPALIVLISTVGLFFDPEATTDTVTEIIEKLGPDNAAATYAGAIRDISTPRATAGVLLFFGSIASIFTASSYISAFSRASQAIYEVDPGKHFWETRPQQVLWTAGMILGAGLIGLSMVLTGPIVSAIAEPLGIGSTAVTIWGIAKWPVLAVLVAALFSALYYVTAPIPEKRAQWAGAGGLLAVIVWMVASAGLGAYVSQFGSYDKTYGALGGIIVLLLWIYVSNIALLLGVELNADQQPGKAARRKARKPA
jgi:membrane protein